MGRTGLVCESPVRFHRLQNWRPITAINQGDFDGDPNTIGDVNWQPLINTPNYPDHFSGASAP